EAGRTYADGVEAARRIGLAETDPSMDLDGWDATVKACLLGNVLMGGHVRPEHVPRQGVSSLAPEAVRDAVADGKRVKQLARGWREGGEVREFVMVEASGTVAEGFSVDVSVGSIESHTK